MLQQYLLCHFFKQVCCCFTSFKYREDYKKELILQNVVRLTIKNRYFCFVKTIKLYQSIQLYKADTRTKQFLPLVDNGISAGFPSPADDFLDNKIDLNKELVKNKDATFFGRVRGESMIGAGLGNGDLLVIDKSLPPKSGKIAVCFIDGEFTVKRIKIEGEIVWLVPENPKFNPIRVTPDNDFVVWGIVTQVIKSV